MANKIINIIYNGSVVASIGEGQTATLSCADKKMLTNVVIAVGTLEKGVKLLTADGYAVTDTNKLYVTTKEE